jgi:hypothetical protein
MSVSKGPGASEEAADAVVVARQPTRASNSALIDVPGDDPLA